jgi:hypothetical protein
LLEEAPIQIVVMAVEQAAQQSRVAAWLAGIPDRAVIVTDCPDPDFRFLRWLLPEWPRNMAPAPTIFTAWSMGDGRAARIARMHGGLSHANATGAPRVIRCAFLADWRALRPCEWLATVIVFSRLRRRAARYRLYISANESQAVDILGEKLPKTVGTSHGQARTTLRVAPGLPTACIHLPTAANCMRASRRNHQVVKKAVEILGSVHGQRCGLPTAATSTTQTRRASGATGQRQVSRFGFQSFLCAKRSLEFPSRGARERAGWWINSADEVAD